MHDGLSDVGYGSQGKEDGEQVCGTGRWTQWGPLCIRCIFCRTAGHVHCDLEALFRLWG